MKKKRTTRQNFVIIVHKTHDNEENVDYLAFLLGGKVKINSYSLEEFGGVDKAVFFKSKEQREIFAQSTTCQVKNRYSTAP